MAKKNSSSNLSISYTWENIRSTYNNDKFKISAPTWNDKCELSDGSYSAWDIQDHSWQLTNKNILIKSKTKLFLKFGNLDWSHGKILVQAESILAKD